MKLAVRQYGNTAVLQCSQQYGSTHQETNGRLQYKVAVRGGGEDFGKRGGGGKGGLSAVKAGDVDSEQKAMKFSFLKFWVLSIFVLNKTERGITLRLNHLVISDSDLIYFLH